MDCSRRALKWMLFGLRERKCANFVPASEGVGDVGKGKAMGLVDRAMGGMSKADGSSWKRRKL